MYSSMYCIVQSVDSTHLLLILPAVGGSHETNYSTSRTISQSSLMWNIDKKNNKHLLKELMLKLTDWLTQELCITIELLQSFLNL